MTIKSKFSISMKRVKTSYTVTFILGVMTSLSTLIPAQTITPVYTATFKDATTGDNEFIWGGKNRWTVDPGADNYNEDYYERPTNQTYIDTPSGVATDSDYFGNLDIKFGYTGIDDSLLYIGIEMWDTQLHKSDGGLDQEGLKYNYSFRMGSEADGRNGYLFRTDDPASQGTSWHTVKNTGFFDQNGDAHIDGNGYEINYIADGMLAIEQTDILWTRINPNNDALVEFALDYSKMGLTREELENYEQLVFEANKGLLDQANYKWNQEYTFSEAGTPYTTDGLGNIYELDTLNGGLIPEPSTSTVLLVGGIVSCLRRRRTQ